MHEIVPFKERGKSKGRKEKTVQQVVGLDSIASGLFPQAHVRILATLPPAQATSIIEEIKSGRKELDDAGDQKKIKEFAEYRREIFRILRQKRKGEDATA